MMEKERMPEEELEEIVARARIAANEADTVEELERLWTSVLGVNGSLTNVVDQLLNMEAIRRANFGVKLKAARVAVAEFIEENRRELERADWRNAPNTISKTTEWFESLERWLREALEASLKRDHEKLKQIREEANAFIKENYEVVHSAGVEYSMSYQKHGNHLHWLKPMVSTWERDEQLWIPSSWEGC